MAENNYSVLRIVWEFAPNIGGSITHITELSQNINCHLKKQIICAPYIKGCEIFDQGFPISVIRLKVPKVCNVSSPIIANGFYSLFIKNKLLKIIKENHINIVHFHSPLLASFCIPYIRAYDKNLKIVVMAHGWYNKQSRHYGISYSLGKLLISSFLPDKYLILDDGTQIQDLQSILDRRSIPWDIVYHGIDSDIFRPDYKSRSSTFSVLFPHRPISIKRPDIAINVFKQFLNRISNTNVSLFYLSANHSDELIRLAAKEGIEGNVQFLDELSGDALIDCINNSSVIIGTSLNSNNGRAIQEAMACQKPVIVFNNKENMSNLIQNLENGILVELENIDDFVEALVLMYSNPDLRSKIGINARKTILNHRSWKKELKRNYMSTTVYYHNMNIFERGIFNF